MPGSSWDSSACRRKPTRSPPSPNCWTPLRTPASSRGRTSPSTPWDARSTSPRRSSTPAAHYVLALKGLVPRGFLMFVDHSQLSYLVCVLATGSAFIYVPGSPVVLEQE